MNSMYRVFKSAYINADENDRVDVFYEIICNLYKSNSETSEYEIIYRYESVIIELDYTKQYFWGLWDDIVDDLQKIPGNRTYSFKGCFDTYKEAQDAVYSQIGHYKDLLLATKADDIHPLV